MAVVAEFAFSVSKGCEIRILLTSLVKFPIVIKSLIIISTIVVVCNTLEELLT